MTAITVVDSIMGTGKTTFAIDLMNSEAYDQTFGGDDESHRFVYIAPYLDEASRIRQTCPALDFVEPQSVRGRKLDHFKQLLADRRNIASTHALFLLSDREVHDLVANANYTLIIDEETECVREYDEISKSDVANLYAHHMIVTEDSGVVRWNHERYRDYEGRFSDVKRLCDNGALVRVDSSLLVWRFPIEFLRMFRRVYVLTYLFEGSLMSAYLKANHMGYDVNTLRTGVGVPALERLVAHNRDHELQRLAELRTLLTIIEDDRLNAVGRRTGKAHPLSVSWFDYVKRTKPESIQKLANAAETFYRHRASGRAGERMWTCYKAYRGDLRGKHLTQRAWTACNLRATNEHRQKRNLAYLANIFLSPKLERYFIRSGVEPNHELYALSAIVQWIWRGQIRDGKPVNLFVPSERMRNLVKRWLSGEGESIATGDGREELSDAA